jgi:hypothetical protein
VCVYGVSKYLMQQHKNDPARCCKQQIHGQFWQDVTFGHEVDIPFQQRFWKNDNFPQHVLSEAPRQVKTVPLAFQAHSRRCLNLD